MPGPRGSQGAQILAASPFPFHFICLSVYPSSSQLHVAPRNLLTVIIIAILPSDCDSIFDPSSLSHSCKVGVNCCYLRQEGLFKARSGGLMTCPPAPFPSPQWPFVSWLHFAAGVPWSQEWEVGSEEGKGGTALGFQGQGGRFPFRGPVEEPTPRG